MNNLTIFGLLIFAIGIVLRLIVSLSFKSWWREMCLHYIIGNNPAQEYTKFPEYCETWPVTYMVAYFWVFDFKRFIVHQESADKILEFFFGEASKNGNE